MQGLPERATQALQTATDRHEPRATPVSQSWLLAKQRHETLLSTATLASSKCNIFERLLLGIFVAMAIGIALGATIFPARFGNAVSTLTLASTGLLIFCMGADLGARDELMGQLANLGFSSVVLCLAPVAFSIVAVYALTSLFMKDIVERHTREKQERSGNTGQALCGEDSSTFAKASSNAVGANEPSSANGVSNPNNSTSANDPGSASSSSEITMIIIAIGSLAFGVAYGLSPLELSPVGTLVEHSDYVLYALMFFVGISVGMSKGLVGKIREYGVRLLLVPAGIIAGSFVAGLVFAPICGLSLGEGAAITSGMGWYSLVGVVLADLAGPQVGSIAFLSNLLRELVSFLIIPWISRHLNYPTCIAPAGATSEDTTLPMIIRCTNEETVVLGVINGIVCSAAVPVLVAICSQFM